MIHRRNFLAGVCASAILVGMAASNAASLTRPLSGALGLNPSETSTFVNERLAMVANSSYDLLNVSGGPGYVNSIWLTIDVAATGKDSIISVFIDGEGSPSCTFDLGNLMGHNATTAGKWSTRHISYEVGTVASFTNVPIYTFKYPLPFKSSCHITITAKTTNANLFSIVEYCTGVTIPFKFISSCRTYANRLVAQTPTQQGNGTIQFLSLPSGAGNNGWIVFHNYVAANGTDQTFLENNAVMYLDGLAPGVGVFPQYNTSGTEDYFKSGFYWVSGTSSNNWTALTSKGTGNITAAIDFLELCGGVRFNDGILMRLETGQAASPGVPDTNADFAWFVGYYIPNP